jgi:L-lactate permease
MQPWMQVYDPAGNLWLSSLIAAIPIIFFFLALAVFRMKGHVAGTITVLLALGGGDGGGPGLPVRIVAHRLDHHRGGVPL